MRHKAIALLGISAISLLFALDASADEATSPAPGSTLVTMSGDPATIQMAVGEGWVDVCTTPCNQSLQAWRMFRIRGGAGELDSRPFELEGHDGRSHLEVSTGTVAGRVLGLVLIPVGAVSLGAGAIMLLAYGISAGPGLLGGNPDSGLFVGGVVALLGGLLALPLGIVLRAVSRTTVVQSESTTAIRTAEWISPRVTPAPTSLGWTFTF